MDFARNIACLALSALAAVVAARAIPTQRRVEAAHEATLVDRARELERFTSRVAHDLLGRPIGDALSSRDAETQR
jgi:hypothetical protein